MTLPTVRFSCYWLVRSRRVPESVTVEEVAKVIAAVVKSGKPTSIPPPPRDHLAAYYGSAGVDPS